MPVKLKVLFVTDNGPVCFRVTGAQCTIVPVKVLFVTYNDPVYVFHITRTQCAIVLVKVVC